LNGHNPVRPVPLAEIPEAGRRELVDVAIDPAFGQAHGHEREFLRRVKLEQPRAARDYSLPDDSLEPLAIVHAGVGLGQPVTHRLVIDRLVLGVYRVKRNGSRADDDTQATVDRADDAESVLGSAELVGYAARAELCGKERLEVNSRRIGRAESKRLPDTCQDVCH
jgi:hypothetical protein